MSRWGGQVGTGTSHSPREVGAGGCNLQGRSPAGRSGHHGSGCPADLFSQCYRHSEERAFALLVRRNRCWSRTTCLHLATEADTKAFFAHDGVQVSPGRAVGNAWADSRCPSQLPQVLPRPCPGHWGWGAPFLEAAHLTPSASHSPH